MLPPFCDPKLRGTWKSATAAAEPVDEPPGVRCLSCGFVVFGPLFRTVNSGVVVFPEKQLDQEQAVIDTTNQR